MQAQKDIYKTSRFLYILEALFEEFISILIGGVYLAKVTTAIGMDDSLTGILSSLTCLGCGFQIFAIFFSNKRKVKGFVTVLHTLNQLLFATMYFVPFFPVTKTVKTVMFMSLLLTGFIIMYITYPSKINWMMSFVPNEKRGRFTATKEMVYLIGDMVLSLAFGGMIDYFESVGNLNGAFLCLGIGLLILTVSHSLTLILSKEKPSMSGAEKKALSIKEQLRETFKDKNLYKITTLITLWTMAQYATTSFYGTYQIKELGFSMVFVSVLGILTALVRALSAKPLGWFADKFSFANMLNISYVIMLVAFAVVSFTVPSNGKIFFTIYTVLCAIGFSGVNSAAINLYYDYIQEKNIVGSMAFCGMVAGFSGFFATLLVSPLVQYIQDNGNTFLGMNVYAQQVVSGIGVLLMIIILLYLNLVVKKMERRDR